MFWMDRTKLQGEAIPAAEALDADVVVSPDTRRAERIPPGQTRTRKWPVLDASGPPEIDLNAWRFRIGGLVGNDDSGAGKDVEWGWQELLTLPRVRVFA